MSSRRDTHGNHAPFLCVPAEEQSHRRGSRSLENLSSSCNRLSSCLVPQAVDIDILLQDGDDSLNDTENQPTCTTVVQFNVNDFPEHIVHAAGSTLRDFDILAFAETRKLKPVLIPGFSVESPDESNYQVGVATYIRNGIPYSRRSDIEQALDSVPETVCIQVGSILLVHSYVHPDVPQKYFQAFLKQIGALSVGTSLMLVGDLNARAACLGNTVTNAKGNALDMFLADTPQLHAINNGKPTFWRRNYSSTLDAAIVTTDLLRKGASWDVMDGTDLLIDSDHLPCVIQLPGCPAEQSKSKWINWKTFREKLSTLLQQRVPWMSCLEEARWFAKSMNEARKAAETVRSNRRTWKPWWNDRLSELKRNRNKALRKGQLDLYRSLRTAFRAAVCDAKRELWRTTCQDADSPAKVWNIFRNSKKRKRQVPAANTGGSRLVEVLADQYEAVSNDTTLQHDSDTEITRHHVVCFDPPSANVEPWEVREVVKNMRRTSSPGVDRVTVTMLQRGGEDVVHFLARHFTHCLTMGRHPYKTAKIYPVPKQTEGEFRPISLLSCVGKALERIVARRLSAVRDLIPEFQYAKTGGGTALALTRLLQKAAEARNLNHSFTSVCLDMSKAYDRVTRSGLVEVLLRKRVPDYLVQFVFSFMTNRKFFVEHAGNVSTVRKLSNGVPQGSPLSLLLFCIYVGDIPTWQQVQCNQYVDDIEVDCSADNPEEVVEHLQSALDDIATWAETKKIKFNARKSFFVTSERSVNTKLKLDGEEIPHKDGKYLGFPMSTNFRPVQAVQHIVRSGYERIALMKRFATMSYGVDLIGLRMMYRALVLSLISFFAPTLHQLTDQQWRKLEVMHNTGMRFITGAMKTTPILALRRISGFHSIRTMVLESQTRLSGKLLRLNSLSPASRAFSTFWRNRPQHMDRTPFDTLCQLRSDCALEYPVSEYQMIDYNEIRTLRCIQVGNDIDKLPPNPLTTGTTWKLFTDGSFIPGTYLGGIGWCIIRNEQIMTQDGMRTSMICSSSCAERLALTHGIRDLREHDLDDSYIEIFSDSKALIYGLINAREGLHDSIESELIRETVALIETRGVNSVIIQWIRGHSGIYGNEVADRLAGSSVNYSAPYPMSTRAERLQVRKHFQERSLAECKSYEGHFAEIAKYASFDSKERQPRPLQILLTRLRTGHCCVGYHLKRKQISLSDICPRCNSSPETIDHVLFDCEPIAEHLRPFRQFNIDLSTLVQQPLCERKQAALRALHTGLSQSGIRL